MSITHGSFTFSQLHGPIRADKPDLRLQRGQFNGVKGESHLIAGITGRQLSCRYTMQDYASFTDIMSAIKSIDQQAGELTGTMTAGGHSFSNCTFIEFQRDRDPFPDGAGTHGWVQFGRLIWIQRK